MAKGKGSSFERLICKTLSRWWSYNATEDIFWRTAGSGARAKTRSKQGRMTFGQYGDIQATNPQGQRFIDVCTLELKRGYSKNTFADLVDKPNAMDSPPPKKTKAKTTKRKPPQTFGSFINQAEADAINANSFTWLLIVKRDRREAMIFMPRAFALILKEKGVRIYNAATFVSLVTNKGDERYKVFGMPLDSFLQLVTPKHIKTIHDDMKKSKALLSIKTLEENGIEPSYRDAKWNQVFKCPNCDENEVRWNGKQYICGECGAVDER